MSYKSGMNKLFKSFGLLLNISNSLVTKNLHKMSIFDFKVPSPKDGEPDIDLTQFRGKKAYIIVNVASE